MLSSLNRQNSQYQLVLVDNTSSKFKSAAQAYNFGAAQATGKYVMFVHQDVDLCSESWLSDAENILDSIGTFGVAGVAGMSEKGRSLKERGRNIITNHEDHREWEFGNPIERPEIVQTLDGCLVIIPASVFKLLQFDERVCDNWHLYDVDYCLSCKELVYEVYAIPLSIYHRSTGPWHHPSRLKILRSLGPLPHTYYKALNNLINKHKSNYRYIYTSNGEWNTFQPVLVQRLTILIKAGFDLIFRGLKRMIKR